MPEFFVKNETRDTMKSKIKIAGAKPRASDEGRSLYFMAAVLAIYEKEGAQKQRHMNILLNLPSPHINKDALANIQRGAMARLTAENGVEAADVKDVIILSTSLLGAMTQEEFEGSTAAAVQPPMAH